MEQAVGIRNFSRAFEVLIPDLASILPERDWHKPCRWDLPIFKLDAATVSYYTSAKYHCAIESSPFDGLDVARGAATVIRSLIAMSAPWDDVFARSAAGPVELFMKRP
jgi:hypothetical protein